jgi:hypothetical protein
MNQAHEWRFEFELASGDGPASIYATLKRAKADWETGEWLGYAHEPPIVILKWFATDHQGFYSLEALCELALFLTRGAPAWSTS